MDRDRDRWVFWRTMEMTSEGCSSEKGRGTDVVMVHGEPSLRIGLRMTKEGC